MIDKLNIQKTYISKRDCITIIASGFEDLESYVGNSCVLVTNSSRLVAIMYLEDKGHIATVDSDYMLRVFDLVSGKHITTLLLKQK